MKVLYGESSIKSINNAIGISSNISQVLTSNLNNHYKFQDDLKFENLSVQKIKS
jgi:hypothetical protein